MRDPKRIRKFMERLTQVWESVPDWRFGQLIENIIRGNGISFMKLFYMEDEEFLKLLDNFVDAVKVVGQ